MTLIWSESSALYVCLCAEALSFKRGVDSVCEVDDPTIVYIIKVTTMGGRREKREHRRISDLCKVESWIQVTKAIRI